MSKKLKDYNEQDITDRLGNMTAGGLLLRVVVGIAVLSMVFGVIGFIGGWFRTGAEIISPANVKAQWQFAYSYDRSLDAISRQYCTAKTAEEAEADPSVKSQRTDQRIAIENNYQRVEAEYDGRLADAFQAKLVRPRDVPAQAPTLAENVSQNC